MRELSHQELEQVCGGAFWGDVGYALGKLAAMGAKMQQHIDSLDNPMLGAISQGA